MTDPVREALKELLASMRMDASAGGRAGGSWDEAAVTAAEEALAAKSPRVVPVVCHGPSFVDGWKVSLVDEKGHVVSRAEPVEWGVDTDGFSNVNTITFARMKKPVRVVMFRLWHGGVCHDSRLDMPRNLNKTVLCDFRPSQLRMLPGMGDTTGCVEVEGKHELQKKLDDTVEMLRKVVDAVEWCDVDDEEDVAETDAVVAEAREYLDHLDGKS